MTSSYESTEPRGLLGELSIITRDLFVMSDITSFTEGLKSLSSPMGHRNPSRKKDAGLVNDNLGSGMNISALEFNKAIRATKKAYALPTVTRISPNRVIIEL